MPTSCKSVGALRNAILIAITEGRGHYLFLCGITFALCLAFMNCSPAEPESLSLLNSHPFHPKHFAVSLPEYLRNYVLFGRRFESTPNNIDGQALPGKMPFHILPDNLQPHTRSTSEPNRGSPAFLLKHSEWFRSRSYLISIDSFLHKRTACFETVQLCVHNNVYTAQMRLCCLTQLILRGKNRTRKFHPVLKVTQIAVFVITWPNRRRHCVHEGKRDCCECWGKAAYHHTHHLLK